MPTASRAWTHRVVIALIALSLGILATVVGCASSSANTTEVKMVNLWFVPQTITISAGTTVRWVNNDQTAHQPMSDNYDPNKPNVDTFSSKPMSPGDTFDFTFKTPGTYKYHCNVHEYMTGTVIVQ